MMSRMERRLARTDLFGTSNNPEEISGFGYFRLLTESFRRATPCTTAV